MKVDGNTLTTNEFKIESFEVLQSNDFGRTSYLVNANGNRKIIAKVFLGDLTNKELNLFRNRISTEPIGKSLILEGFKFEKKFHFNSIVTSPEVVNRYLNILKCRNRVYSMFATKDGKKYYIGYVSEFINID